jgi:hypothetical protein
MKQQFEIMTLSWYKRRTPTYTPPTVVDFTVHNFEKIDNHKCSVEVLYDNDEQITLNAYVSRSCIYKTDGTISRESWSVHGLDHSGHTILLKVVD